MRLPSDLREKYSNAWGYIRMGVLLEDLDALAGTIAFSHCDDRNPATRPLLLVTACVDQITILRPLRMIHDIELRGQVSWVGRSSMEIRMEVASLTDDNTVLEAFCKRALVAVSSRVLCRSPCPGLLLSRFTPLTSSP